MLTTNLLTGKLVHLGAIDPETTSAQLSKWRGNSEYARLLDSDPAVLFSEKAIRAWTEKHMDDWLLHEFNIRTVDGDQFIGFVGLSSKIKMHADAFVGIGIGEAELWGKGYGTEAMKLVLAYAFLELNLHRVSLNVFEYNPRAMHSYEKAGFKVEGRQRGGLLREGKRWDMIYMGILREEWQQAQQDSL